MTALYAVEVEEMEPSKATRLFQRYAKITKEGSNGTREVDGIVKELGYLVLTITLAGPYVSATTPLSSNIGKYLPKYRQRRKGTAPMKAQAA